GITSQYSQYAPGGYNPDTGQGWNGSWTFDDAVNVLLGHGDGAFDPARITWVNLTGSAWFDVSGPGELAVGDFNGDGNLDLVAAEGITPKMWAPSALLGAGDGNFRPIYYNNGGSGPYAAVLGDFDGDTFPDVALANYSSADVSVLMNDTEWRTLVVSGLP